MAAKLHALPCRTVLMRFTAPARTGKADRKLSGCFDPYEEHDFGSFEADGHKIFFKIDYYHSTLTVHSPDPSDPAVTNRVITIMLAEEY